MKKAKNENLLDSDLCMLIGDKDGWRDVTVTTANLNYFWLRLNTKDNCEL